MFLNTLLFKISQIISKKENKLRMRKTRKEHSLKKLKPAWMML